MSPFRPPQQLTNFVCVTLRYKAGAPFAVVRTIFLALACSQDQNNGRPPHSPTQVWRTPFVRPVCDRRQDAQWPYSRTPGSFAYGDSPSVATNRKEAFFFPFQAHCSLDASEYITWVRRAKGDCTEGTVSLQVGSTQWIRGRWAAQELQSRTKTHPLARGLFSIHS